jgi:hypothetical protein
MAGCGRCFDCPGHRQSGGFDSMDGRDKRPRRRRRWTAPVERSGQDPGGRRAAKRQQLPAGGRGCPAPRENGMKRAERRRADASDRRYRAQRPAVEAVRTWVSRRHLQWFPHRRPGRTRLASIRTGYPGGFGRAPAGSGVGQDCAEHRSGDRRQQRGQDQAVQNLPQSGCLKSPSHDVCTIPRDHYTGFPPIGARVRPLHPNIGMVLPDEGIPPGHSNPAPGQSAVPGLPGNRAG